MPGRARAGRAHARRAARVPEGRGAVARSARSGPRRATTPGHRRAARPRRRARPRQRAARARGRGGGRPPPAARRPARRRQDDARPPAADDPARARTRRRARGHAHPLGRRARTAVSALQTEPPFRAPHHSASSVALVGGGSPRVRPGEITLAHRGALFLDELPEFPISVLEGAAPAARGTRRPHQPAHRERSSSPPTSCSSRAPTRARAGATEMACRCGDAQRMRYARRLVGAAPRPLRSPAADRLGRAPKPANRRRRRARESAPRSNANERDSREPAGDATRTFPPGALERLVPLASDAHAAWLDACRLRRLTGRGAARVRRVARTFADLDDHEIVNADHVMRAAFLREDVW